MESDADEQLIIRIPFTASGLVLPVEEMRELINVPAKLRSILIKTSGSSAPLHVSLFPNPSTDLDFEECSSLKPTEKIDVVDSDQVVEYPLR